MVPEHITVSRLWISISYDLIGTLPPNHCHQEQRCARSAQELVTQGSRYVEVWGISFSAAQTLFITENEDFGNVEVPQFQQGRLLRD
jgi:hypothetical protein